VVHNCVYPTVSSIHCLILNNETRFIVTLPQLFHVSITSRDKRHVSVSAGEAKVSVSSRSRGFYISCPSVAKITLGEKIRKCQGNKQTMGKSDGHLVKPENYWLSVLAAVRSCAFQSCVFSVAAVYTTRTASARLSVSLPRYLRESSSGVHCMTNMWQLEQKSRQDSFIIVRYFWDA